MTFNINNMDYTVNIGADKNGILEKELRKLLPAGKSIDTKRLLSAYMHQTLVVLQYKQKIDEMLDKIDA